LLKFPEGDKQRQFAAPRLAAIRFLGFGTVIAFLTHGRAQPWPKREKNGGMVDPPGTRNQERRER
jgi:hypothetical protein